MPAHGRTRWQAARGFTLAESLAASVILAASVVGISGAIGSSYHQARVQDEMTTALDLARQLMEEISAQPMDVSGTNQPGWSAGVTERALYDTIDDFNGYTDTSDSIRMADGTSLDAGNGSSYTRSVSVQASARPAGLTGLSANFALVTVTVAMPHGQSVALSELFTRAKVVR